MSTSLALKVASRIILSGQRDAFKRYEDGSTLLHVSASHGDIAEIDRLIAYGANVNARAKDGDTPLHCAARECQPVVVDALIGYGANINARGFARMTPLHWAATEGHFEVVDRLIRTGTHYRQTSPDLWGTPVGVLFRNGADINARDIKQQTSLQWQFVPVMC